MNARKVMRTLVLPTALVASGLLVMGGSNAAFSGASSNDGNSWAAGTVTIKNDRTSAMFAATGVTPGYSETHCMTVVSSSDVPTTLKMYSANLAGTGTPTTLPQNLNIQIVEGSGSTNANCTGFVAAAGQPDFSGTLDSFGAVNNYANGVGAARVAPGASNQYKITVSLPSDAPNTLQGTSAAVKFIWEAQG